MKVSITGEFIRFLQDLIRKHYDEVCEECTVWKRRGEDTIRNRRRVRHDFRIVEIVQRGKRLVRFRGKGILGPARWSLLLFFLRNVSIYVSFKFCAYGEETARKRRIFESRSLVACSR